MFFITSIWKCFKDKYTVVILKLYPETLQYLSPREVELNSPLLEFRLVLMTHFWRMKYDRNYVMSLLNYILKWLRLLILNHLFPSLSLSLLLSHVPSLPSFSLSYELFYSWWSKWPYYVDTLWAYGQMFMTRDWELSGFTQHWKQVLTVRLWKECNKGHQSLEAFPWTKLVEVMKFQLSYLKS